jgi:hypothetical protein
MRVMERTGTRKYSISGSGISAKHSGSPINVC